VPTGGDTSLVSAIKAPQSAQKLGVATSASPADWRKGRDGLKAWFDEMMQNPAVAETKPIF